MFTRRCHQPPNREIEMGEADTTELLRAVLKGGSPWRREATDVGRPDYYQCRCCGVWNALDGFSETFEDAQAAWADTHLAWCPWRLAVQAIG